MTEKENGRYLCGHEHRTLGCGGCDPGAIDFVLTDQGHLRAFDPAIDLRPASALGPRNALRTPQAMTQTSESTQTLAAEPLPIKVAAYITTSKGDQEDPSTRAAFANSDRAESYARMLADDRRYAAVYLWDAQGTCWEVPASVLVNSDGEAIG